MATKMEVDGSGPTVMASAGTTGSVSVSLHPLVIMNISEHWTRVRAQEGKATQGSWSKESIKIFPSHSEPQAFGSCRVTSCR